jgi:hypothetical protein
MTLSIRLLLFTLAFVLFAVSAYLSEKLPEKLTRAAFAIVVLAWLLV